MAQNASQKTTQAFASKHLRYELEMTAGLVLRMHKTWRLLQVDPRPGGDLGDHALELVGRNADVEAFGIHARALIDFLYGGKASDVSARDFFDDPDAWSRVRPKKPRILEEVNSRVGKEIAHLRYERVSPSKDWAYGEIWAALADVLRVFFENASPSRVGRKFAKSSLAFLNASARVYQPNAGGPVATTSASPDPSWTPRVTAATGGARGATATYAPELYDPAD